MRPTRSIPGRSSTSSYSPVSDPALEIQVKSSDRPGVDGGVASSDGVEAPEEADASDGGEVLLVISTSTSSVAETILTRAPASEQRVWMLPPPRTLRTGISTSIWLKNQDRISMAIKLSTPSAKSGWDTSMFSAAACKIRLIF